MNTAEKIKKVIFLLDLVNKKLDKLYIKHLAESKK